MNTQTHPIRSEVLSVLRSNIKKHSFNESVYTNLINDLANKLILVNDPSTRKELIKKWYKDLEGAKSISRHHLYYQNPDETKQLNNALSDLTVRYKKRFHNYFQ